MFFVVYIKSGPVGGVPGCVWDKTMKKAEPKKEPPLVFLFDAA